jgi:cellulose synthase/poly-beta-1,6-N-acetylglucosamine synthase-like glycosyltransferase
MDLPIPLGGTSNHFRTDVLRDLLGWDAWNVTEDADLGVRAERLGWRVGIVSSTTWEEACSAWKPWIRQRTRWIKGYLVTAQVHLRHPWTYVRESGIRGVFGMTALIVGTPAMFLLWPILLAVTLVALVVPDQMSNLLPYWMQRASAVNLVMGNLTMMGLSAAAVGRRKLWPLLGFALLVPGYFALHAIAAWRAAYQLIFDPFRWEKTPHGISPGHDDDEVAPQPFPEPRPAVTGATEPSRAADDELVAHR